MTDERHQSHSLAPRQVTYEVKGKTYKVSEIPSFLEEVQLYIDPLSLEVAWELLAAEGQLVTSPEMAMLLFGESSLSQCYAAHWLLSEDKIYFKQKGDGYEPRTAAQVAERKHQLEGVRSKPVGRGIRRWLMEGCVFSKWGKLYVNPYPTLNLRLTLRSTAASNLSDSTRRLATVGVQADC